MDELYDDEKAKVKEQREAAAAYKERLCGVVLRLAETNDGKEFLRWLITVCGVLRVEYPADHARAAWDAGKREVGLNVVSLAHKSGVLEQIIREDAEYE